MPRSRLLSTLLATLCAALAAACSGKSETPAAPLPPDAGQTVAVGQNGLPRFVAPGAAAGTESEVTVGAGATVTWRFLAGGYSVVSGGTGPDGGMPADGGPCAPDGVFCSPNDQGCDGGIPPQAAGSFYQHVFPDAGDFAYFSQPGCLQGMTGVVHVLPPPDGGP